MRLFNYLGELRGAHDANDMIRMFRKNFNIFLNMNSYWGQVGIGDDERGLHRKETWFGNMV
jgi:hypothetical protein